MSKFSFAISLCLLLDKLPHVSFVAVLMERPVVNVLHALHFSLFRYVDPHKAFATEI